MDLTRLFRPKSIAVIGGGSWSSNVLKELEKLDYSGPIWPIHPSKSQLAGMKTARSLEDLDAAPDATFIGVNRDSTIEIVRQLKSMDAGGAVCFASGFQEAENELQDGSQRQAELVASAGTLPILGPNCYGFINYLDRAALWPDQHGGRDVDGGVAVITQSSNIAINLTMQRRGLPIAYMVTVGNQAQLGFSDVGRTLLDDPRVTALGLHIEGIGDIAKFQDLAEHAHRIGKPIVALKVGVSEHAQSATISHTASLAGSAAGSSALLKRCGIGQVHSLAGLLEALKLLHVCGPLRSTAIASLSCSGGEASLMADTSASKLQLPPLNPSQKKDLREVLGERVALSNPLDYHTYIWDDRVALEKTYTAMIEPTNALTCIILDFPRSDMPVDPAWTKVIDAAAEVHRAAKQPVAIVGSLPENISEATALGIMERGLVPLCGLPEAVEAISAACKRAPDLTPLLSPKIGDSFETLSEDDAKSALGTHGVRVPRRVTCAKADIAEAASRFSFPIVVKSDGLAHKSEHDGVVLDVNSVAQAVVVADKMPTADLLIEEMVTGTIAELLIGVVQDPAHGLLLTIGAGGTLTELIKDRTHLLLPVQAQDIREALDRLSIAPLLKGYRGKPAADLEAIVETVLAVQSYVEHTPVAELEINPLICRTHDAIAVDALIRKVL